MEPMEPKGNSYTLQSVDLGKENGQEESSKLERKRTLRHRRNLVTEKAHLSAGRTRLFGTNCNFATDSFFGLSLFALALRLTWLLLGLGVSTYVFIAPGLCEQLEVPLPLKVSLLGLLGLCAVTIISCITCTIISSLGSLIRPKPREKVIVPVYILMVLSVVEFCWLIFSTYAAATSADGSIAVSEEDVASGMGMAASGIGSGEVGNGTTCRIVVLFRTAVGLEWVVFSVILILFVTLLDPCGYFLPFRYIKKVVAAHENYNMERDSLEESLTYYDEYDSIEGLHHNKVNRSLLWAKFKQTFCSCCRRDGLSNSKRAALGDVVKVLRILFSDVDVTSSYLISGFLLTRLYQKKLKTVNKHPETELTQATVNILKEKDIIPLTYTPPLPTPLDTVEIEQLSDDLNYYFKFCVAAYGSPIQLYLNPITGPFTLCMAAKGCCCCNICQLEQFEGDTCFPNTAAIQDIAGVYPEDIITASFINSVYKVPYYAVHEHQEKRVVVAIRGTLSLEDALTDVSVHMWQIPNGLLGSDQCYIHKGFYETAIYVYKSLMKSTRFVGLLDLDKVDEIVITGHSLGAAVASVLAVIFKDRHKDAPWIHRLRAVTFSTPGALMDYKLAEKTKDFVITVVGANDLVSRMTIRSLGHLKLLVQTMLATVDSPKHQVLCCSGSVNGYFSPSSRVLQDEEILGLAYTQEDLQSTEHLNLDGDPTRSFNKLKTYKPFTSVLPAWRRGENVEAVNQLIKELNQVNGGALESDSHPMMFVPGRILHLEESDQYGLYQCCGLRKKRRVKASWKAREDISAIIVDPDMFLDHSPHRVLSLLQRFQEYPDTEPIAHTPGPTHSTEEEEAMRARGFSIP